MDIDQTPGDDQSQISWATTNLKSQISNDKWKMKLFVHFMIC